MKKTVLLLALLTASLMATSGYSQDLIKLAWDAVQDADLVHYTMYRDSIPGTMVYLDSIPKTDFEYEDKNVEPSKAYYYKITASDSAGNESEPSNEVMAVAGTITFAEDMQHSEVEEFRLGQNYPNPFNPSTTIDYRVPTAAKVTLVVYDIMGNKIRRLVDGFKAAGIYRAVWDGKDASGKQVASGVYFYQMIAGDFAEVRKTAFAK